MSCITFFFNSLLSLNDKTIRKAVSFLNYAITARGREWLLQNPKINIIDVSPNPAKDTLDKTFAKLEHNTQKSGNRPLNRR